MIDLCCTIDDDSRYTSISDNNEIEFSNECIAECFGFESHGVDYSNACVARCDGVFFQSMCNIYNIYIKYLISVSN